MQFQKLLVLALLLILIGNASAVDITKCIAINSPGTYVLQNNLTMTVSQ